MAKPSAHPGFRKLLTEWNQKLSDSGFKDIESSRIGEPTLKQSTGTVRRYEKLDPIVRQAKEHFFERLAQNIAQTPLRNQLTFQFHPARLPRKKAPYFENETELYILRLFAQGVPQKEIQRRLGIRGHRCNVYKPLNRWLKLWGLKK